MKFFTYEIDSAAPRLGVVLGEGGAFDVTELLAHSLAPKSRSNIPQNLLSLIALPDQGASTMADISAAPQEAKDKCQINLESIVWCAPIVRPRRNVFCVGRNYKAHIIEGNVARGRNINDFPRAVEFFTKPPSTVRGHQRAVSNHQASTQKLDYEVELAIVIGKRGINIAEKDAMDHVFGYTILNDITARDLQDLHGQWFKGKGLDGTCPMGPYVVPSQFIEQPHKLRIALSVNGEPRQDSNTADLLFSIPQIVSQLSNGMALEPGDVIATGTPSGVGLGLTPQKFLKPGDVITAHIESIGELTNTISLGD
ncbi:fumarylacetoacetate hydrolase family protein [Ottowia thiooxydans]|uniref:fumarylacetoacetate hydrolase family protein n=1 Tax=Ottowia thiooxydans TaxID=219182 RepID=UPI00048D8618|nr:fumarylacetoacetate hydrolase family protein [Ottowia thiooxydans]